MPRKNLGKKINEDGTLEDLGNTVSDEDLEKLDGIEEGAQKNAQADWSVTDSTSDAYIKNKSLVVNKADAQTISGLKTFTNGLKLGQYGLQIKGDALDDPDFDEITEPGIYFCYEIFNGPIDFTGITTLVGATGGALIVLPDRTQILSYWGKIFVRKFSIGQSVSTYAISGGGSTTTLPTVPEAGAYGEWVDIIDSENEVFNFAQEEYNKSLNEFKFRNRSSEITSTNGVEWSIQDGVIILNGTSTSSGGIQIKYYLDDVDLSNQTYTYAMVDSTTIPTGAYFTLRDANNVDISQLNVQYASRTINSNSTIDNLWIWIDSGVTFNNAQFKLMLVKGSTVPSEFYQGNANKHITNGEAVFLKNEFNKSSNLYDFSKIVVSMYNSTSYIIGEDYIKQYPTDIYGYRVYSIDGLEISKSYTISFNAYAVNNSNSTPSVLVNNIEDIWTNEAIDSFNLGKADLSSSDTRYVYTFTATTTKVNLCLYNNHDNIDETDYIYVNKITLNEGNKDLGYQKFFGEIVHKADITPVLLWENASPNAEFATQTVELTDSADQYSLIRIDIKRNNASSSGPIGFFIKPTVVNVIYPLSTMFYYSGTEYRYSRVCAFYRFSGLFFEDCYLNGSLNNYQLVPVAIYGYKY